MSNDNISSNDQILKSFGFDIPENDLKSNKPLEVVVVIKTGHHYKFKTVVISKISAFISSMFDDESKSIDNVIELPNIIDEKFMCFLLDYADYVERYGISSYNIEKIKAATTLENAIDNILYEIFVKHFDYKFIRSDLAVKQYLNIFGHFLECSTAIVSESLITVFAIAIKIIIQHLPGAEFIISDD